eukprot:CAMPEP_0177625148 /NCGR_PEP_ID=MMETSP0419_2-20121207/29927_1 /TAXON_ID=582737 /ORGANISM="Tetraselmis sp., Strain GSL018" /LENGTH=427 /DNA_ID=CAMNT_0019126039 /DNA_START=66 /DNA_END=1348 /DNA_ORIENTATION=-
MTFKLASLPLARDVSVQLASAEMTGSQVFQGTYISYAHLADMLKNFESSFRGMPTFDQEAMKKHFLSCLQADVLRVARTFDKVAGSLIKAGTGARRWWSRQVGGWAAKVKNPSLPSAASNPKLLRKLARECLEYAEMNKQVLRALVSQYEGHFGTGEAAAFLDKCWDPSSDDCLSFLVSPLKEDLEAVCLDEPLVRSAARLPALCLSPPLAMGAEMANDDDEISDNDLLQCPICYEVKYKPVALAMRAQLLPALRARRSEAHDDDRELLCGQDEDRGPAPPRDLPDVQTDGGLLQCDGAEGDRHARECEVSEGLPAEAAGGAAPGAHRAARVHTQAAARDDPQWPRAGQGALPRRVDPPGNGGQDAAEAWAEVSVNCPFRWKSCTQQILAVTRSDPMQRPVRELRQIPPPPLMSVQSGVSTGLAAFQ